jgi:hypothetical protein
VISRRTRPSGSSARSTRRWTAPARASRLTGTLGKGLEAAAITTDDRGAGREDLSRDLGAAPTGKQFDINFRIIDAVSSAPVLESGCYRFTVDL